MLPKPQLDQKQPGFYVGGPVRLPFYDGRNKTFFLFNYEAARIERGSSAFYTVPNPSELARTIHARPIIDPLTGQPFPNNIIPQARWSRLARLSAPWYPAPNTDAAQGNYQVVRTLPQTQDQFTIRGDQDLGKFGRSFVRITKTMYDNRTDSNLQEIGDRVFVQDTTNWQATHTLAWRANLVNQFRVGHVSARADQKGIPCPQSDVDSLQLTGVFTNIPDDQRECPQVGIQGYAGVGGAGNAYSASNQPMWDISNTTTWIHGSHQLNFGLNYRSWQLQRDLATGQLGGVWLQHRFHRQPRGRLPARLLRQVRHCSSRPRSACRGRRAIPASSTSSTSRRTSRTTGRSRRALRSTSDCAGTTAACRTRRGIAWRGAISITHPADCSWPTRPSSRAASPTAPTTSMPGVAAPKTPTATKSLRRARDLPGGRSPTRRPSCGAATACSSIPRRAVRSTAPRTCIRT